MITERRHVSIHRNRFGGADGGSDKGYSPTAFRLSAHWSTSECHALDTVFRVWEALELGRKVKEGKSKVGLKTDTVFQG